MLAAVLAALQADTTLASLLPGGIYDAGAVGVISKPTTPLAFDSNGELRPCALVQANRLTPVPGFRTIETLTLSLYLYQRIGTASIEPARIRAYSLINRKRLASTGQQAWELQHSEDILAQRDVALRASLIVSRYTMPLT